MQTVRTTDALIPLQDLDLQIHRLKVQRGEKPRQLASFEEKQSHAKDNLTAIQGEIHDLKLDGSKREKVVKEFDEKITKRQADSMIVKKNDEYQAIQKEISGLKADRGRAEDGLLDVYLQVDEKSKLEKLRQDESKQAEGAHAEAKKRIEKEMSTVDREIEDVLGKRGALTAGVEKDVLRLYERILRAKEDGVSLAAAGKYEALEDKGKVVYLQCEGCSMSLNSQDVNLLMMGREVQTCRNCSRILYIKPE